MLPRTPTMLLGLGLLCVLQLSLAQDIRCPAELLVNSNGSLGFSELPTTTPVPIPVYDPGAIGGWYNLIGRFVDAARPGTLPYDVIIRAINETNLPCTINPSPDCTSSASNFDIQGLLQGFAGWWAGIIVVVAIGAILALLFAIVGCIFWCCRCCGNCGGGRKGTEYRYNDCKTITFTIILLLFTLLMLAVVILAFFSNQQAYGSLEGIQTSLGNAANVASAYVDNAVDQIETLLCQFLGDGGVGTTVLNEAIALNDTLGDIIANLRVDVVNILETLDGLTTGINNTLSVLTNISTTSDTLQQLGSNLQDTTSDIATNVSNLATQCMVVPALATICSQIPPSSTFATGANFSQLPDISGQINDVSNALQGIDLQQQIQQGLQQFDSTTQNIQNQVSANLDSNTGALSQVMQLNQSIFGALGNVTSMVRRFSSNEDPDSCSSLGDIFSSLDVNTLNVGFVRDCVVNQGIDVVRQYDVYRYAFGIVFCSLGLVTFVLVSLGIVLGMVALRRDTRPYERNKVTHCGGIFLLIAVGFTFLFGFLLMVLAAIGFFFGANAQKVCQSLERSDYPLFTNIIDNTALWRGSLLGILIFQPLGFSDRSLFISEALRNCNDDMALYSAFNLSNLLPSGSITQEVENAINLTQVTGQISNLLDDAIMSFDFQNNSFLPNSAQDAIQQFTDANVNNINISSFRQQIEAPLVQFSINETIQNLTSIRDSLLGAPIPQTALAMQTQDIIDALNDIQDNQIPAIRAEVVSLEEGVNELSTSVANAVMSTADATNRVNEVVQELTGETLPDLLNETVRDALDRVVSQINGYIAYLDTSLSQEVARCQPIIVVYEELYNSVCRVAVDGLNGFWWSLGFCGVLFIPIIIFAVITSVFYLRMKYYLQDTDDSYVDYSDMPMKSY